MSRPIFLRLSLASSSSGCAYSSASRSALLLTQPPRPRFSNPNATQAERRSFFSFPDLPSSPPQTLTATRALPYPSDDLYELIADVDSYSSFVPYCAVSRVTHWSKPDLPASSSSGSSDLHARPWPTQADLRVGWGGFEETFTSRLNCVPGRSVEALSGADAASQVQAPSGGAARARSGAERAEDSGGVVFKSLITRWDVRPVESGGAATPLTEVGLVIRFQFANPLYAAVSAAVSDKVAGVMIEAFEKRARRLLGPPKPSH